MVTLRLLPAVPRWAGPMISSRFPLVPKKLTVTEPGSGGSGIGGIPNPLRDPEVAFVIIILNQVTVGLGNLNNVLVGIEAVTGKQARRIGAGGVDVILNSVIKHVEGVEVGKPAGADCAAGAGAHGGVGGNTRDGKAQISGAGGVPECPAMGRETAPRGGLCYAAVGLASLALHALRRVPHAIPRRKLNLDANSGQECDNFRSGVDNA